MKLPTALVSAVSALALGGSVASAAPAVAGSAASPVATASSSAHPTGGFTKRVVATGLGNPYEIVWGPDGFLWVTEKSGLKVTRVNPTTGARTTVLRVPDDVSAGQAGVLGLALHPLLLRHLGRDYVYVSYDYGPRRRRRSPARPCAPRSSGTPTTPGRNGCTARGTSSPGCPGAPTTSPLGSASAWTASCTTRSVTRAGTSLRTTAGPTGRSASPRRRRSAAGTGRRTRARPCG